MNRRDAMGALVGVTATCWVGTGQAAQGSTTRVRPGMPFTVGCSGADAFRLEADGLPTRMIDAQNGCVRVRAPWIRTEETWLTLVCTPLANGKPIGRAARVDVLVEMPGFGG